MGNETPRLRSKTWVGRPPLDWPFSDPLYGGPGCDGDTRHPDSPQGRTVSGLPTNLGEAGVRVPPYYDIPGIGDVMDVTDAMAPLGWNFNHGCILKYMVRAGRKPGQDPRKDWTKLMRCAARELRRIGGEVPDDL